MAIRNGTLLVGLCVITQNLTAAQAPVKVSGKFIPRKEAKEKFPPDPQKLSDIARLEVEADSNAGVARVVFEVDDQFRAEVKMPPYRYDWDTLNENDGPHTITAIAYNANGQTGVLRQKVTVENKLSLGIPHYADLALQAMRRGDDVMLEKAARKAYKISTAEPDAIRAMATYIGFKGDVDQAFRMLEDRQSGIIDDEVTLEIKGFLQLLRAGRNPNLIAMLPDLKVGLGMARQRARLIIDETKKKIPDSSKDPQALLTRGDIYWSYHKYEAALASYTAMEQLPLDSTLLRRVQLRKGITLMRLGRTKEADTLARSLLSKGENDYTAQALYAAVLYSQHRYSDAQQVSEKGAEKKNLAAMLVCSMSDMIMGAKARGYKLVRDSFKLLDGTETQFAALAVLGEAGEKDNARKAFTFAIMNSPLSVSTLNEYAYHAIAFDNAPDRFQFALNIFDVAQSLEPENADVLAGRAVAYYGLRRWKSFNNCLEKLQNVAPSAPDLFMLMAVDLNRDAAKAHTVSEAIARAKKIDPHNFNFADVPKPEVLATKMMRSRRTPPLTPFVLDRADSPPPLEEPETATTASK
jgi:tetratricopeptide (TPR) repeat protein